jgi:hypothetical protein
LDCSAVAHRDCSIGREEVKPNGDGKHHLVIDEKLVNEALKPLL